MIKSVLKIQRHYPGAQQRELKFTTAEMLEGLIPSDQKTF